MIYKGRVLAALACLAALTVLAVFTACTSNSGISSGSNTATNAESAQDSNRDTLPESIWSLGIDTVTLDDTPVTEADFKDNSLTVLNIWATWCPPCISELPHLQEVSERFKDKNVQIIGVLQDGITASGAQNPDVIAAAKTLLSEAGASYTVILPDKTITTQFINSMQYYPTTFFINSNGRVIHVIAGARDAGSWEKAINEVLQNS